MSGKITHTFFIHKTFGKKIDNRSTKYFNFKKMIVVPVKEGENIEKALKKFKRKFEKTGTVKELRRRQQFDKPSVTKRLKKERAVYVQQLQQVED